MRTERTDDRNNPCKENMTLKDIKNKWRSWRSRYPEYSDFMYFVPVRLELLIRRERLKARREGIYWADRRRGLKAIMGKWKRRKNFGKYTQYKRLYEEHLSKKGIL